MFGSIWIPPDLLRCVRTHADAFRSVRAVSGNEDSGILQSVLNVFGCQNDKKLSSRRRTCDASDPLKCISTAEEPSTLQSMSKKIAVWQGKPANSIEGSLNLLEKLLLHRRAKLTCLRRNIGFRRFSQIFEISADVRGDLCEFSWRWLWNVADFR